MAVLQAKAPNPQTMRKIVLEGHRFAPKEALVLGLVDHIAGGGTESLLGEAQAMAGKLGPLAKTGAWGVNKVSVCACAMNVKEAVPRCVITGPCWSRRELMQTLRRLDCSANFTERPSRPLSGKCFLWTCCRMMRQRRRVFDG